MQYTLIIEISTETQRRTVAYLLRESKVDFVWYNEESKFMIITADASIIQHLGMYLTSISGA